MSIYRNMNVRWSEKEIKIISDNYSVKEISELCNLLPNRNIKSIRIKASKLGLKSVISWSEEEDYILYKFYGKKHHSEYSSLLNNRTHSSILNRANKLGIKADKYKYVYKYNVNHYYFKYVNLENSYWAGFIAADGWVDNNGTSTLGIKLSNNDVNHIERFKIDIDSNNPIKIRKVESFGRIRKYCVINIYSADILSDLCKNYNITPNKTFTLMPPNIDDIKCKISFICGLLDGDGTIYTIGDSKRITFLGNENIIKWIKNTISEIVCVDNISIRVKDKIYSFCITGEKADKFIKYVNELGIGQLLKRKWL